MRQSLAALILAIGALVFSPALGHAAIESKLPDQGDFWQPLRPNGGSYVYANSFVAPVTGVVTQLGMWLNSRGTAGSTILFQVLDSLGGNPANGPDTSAVLASTAVLGPFTGPLTFYSAAETGGSATLVGGQTYWFAGNVIGQSGTGEYGVGNHTPGFGGSDLGTFWYSNSPNGGNYDGRGLTPEMAFELTIEPRNGVVPEAASLAVWALLGTIGGGAWWKRRRVA